MVEWRDITQVLRHSGPILDKAYLAGWAKMLGLEALLEKAEAASSS